MLKIDSVIDLVKPKANPMNNMLLRSHTADWINFKSLGWNMEYGKCRAKVERVETMVAKQ